jgi:hypothetical protein
MVGPYMDSCPYVLMTEKIICIWDQGVPRMGSKAYSRDCCNVAHPHPSSSSGTAPRIKPTD